MYPYTFRSLERGVRSVWIIGSRSWGDYPSSLLISTGIVEYLRPSHDHAPKYRWSNWDFRRILGHNALLSCPTGNVDLALRDTVRLYEAAATSIEKQFTFEVIMGVVMQSAGARM